MRSSILSLSEWDARVSEAYSLIILSKCTHQHSLEVVNKYVHTELNSKMPSGRSRYTNYDRGYVQGLISAHRNRIWKDHVEFCYMVDGVLYSTHRVSSHRLSSEIDGKILCNSQGSHYWKNSDKVY